MWAGRWPVTAKAAQSKGPSPFFVAGLLVVLFAAAATIAFLGLRLQGAEAGLLVEELFGAEPSLPFGLELAGAATNANQQRSIRFARRVSPEGPPEPEDEPNEVTIIRYAGPGPVQRLFAPSPYAPEELSRRVEEWKKEPNRDLEANLGTGEIRFGRWRVDYVHVRLYFKTATFQDVVRVNTTVGDLTQVLFAFWPKGSEAADPERLVPLLEAMRFDAMWEDYQTRKSAEEGVERGADAATNVPG